MIDARLLALVVIVTATAAFLVAWSAVLAMNVEAWLSTATGYLGIAIVCLVLFLPLWYWYERDGQKSV